MQPKGPYFAMARLITMRWISLVPSKIV